MFEDEKITRSRFWKQILLLKGQFAALIELNWFSLNLRILFGLPQEFIFINPVTVYLNIPYQKGQQFLLGL